MGYALLWIEGLLVGLLLIAVATACAARLESRRWQRVWAAGVLLLVVLPAGALSTVLWWFTAKPRPYMAVSGLFLVLYGCFRFFIEFYRVPDADIGYLALDWVTMGQALSVPMIALGATMLAMAYGSRNKEATA